MVLPMRSHPPPRRRSALGPLQLCALAAVLLLLLSLSVLHSRLSSSSSSAIHPHFQSQSQSQSSNADTRTDALPLPRRDPLPTPALSLDLTDDLDILDDDSSTPSSSSSPSQSLVWDHILGAARIPFAASHSLTPLDPDLDLHLYLPSASHRPRLLLFSSDDDPLDEDVRAHLSSISAIEDALLIKPPTGESPLRQGWAKWLEAKADFLRKNRMLHSNLDFLNPKNHPLLQDPDVPGLTALTRADRLVHRLLLSQMDTLPFAAKSQPTTQFHKEQQLKHKTKDRQEDTNNARRWAHFPGIDPYLSFSQFMQRFFAQENNCQIKVFMVWNSPQWTYGVRHQRGLETLLKHHNHACVVVFSETMELEFFKDFVKDGYKVAVALPNLDELLEGTPTRLFASLWFDWRKTKHYPLHYSELIRLAALYKYGGIYLDSDVIVLKPLSEVQNSIGLSGHTEGNSTFTGAVMAFEKNSDFVMECLREFYATYDDSRLRWNGADLLTRVINKLKGSNQLHVNILPSFQFFPISSSNITSYFAEPSDATDVLEQDILFKRIMEESSGFHLWNSITSSLVPEPKSLVERILNHFCLRCLDII